MYSTYSPSTSRWWGNRAEREGYVLMKRVYPTSMVQGRPCTREEVWLTRTAKPIKPYTPKGPKGKGPPTGYWPWRVADHWQAINGSPLRVPEVIAWQLGEEKRTKNVKGKEVLKPFDPGERSTRDKVRVPMFVHTVTALANVRNTLVHMFGGTLAPPKQRRGQVNSYRQRQRMEFWDHSYGIPTMLEPLVTTGPMLRMLCLELLVEPEFGPDGTLTKFVPLDPEDAAQEFRLLSGMDLTPRNRYLLAAQQPLAL